MCKSSFEKVELNSFNNLKHVFQNDSGSIQNAIILGKGEEQR